MLYDGLDIDEKEAKKDFKPDVSGWGSRSKLLETQKQLQAKKAASLLNLKKRSNTTVAPVFDLKKRTEDNQLTFNMLTGKMERKIMAGSPQTPVSMPSIPGPFIANEAPGTFLGATDEYDPCRPNDYESYTKLRKEQKQKERDEERKKEMEEREKRRKERHRENYDSDEEEEEDRRRRHRSRRQEEEDEEEEDKQRRDKERERTRDQSRTPSRGAAIAPPQSLIEETKPEPPQEEGAASGEYGGGFNVGKASGKTRGSVVSRMMAKMGYREGQGLGKSEQGMSTALQVEKTSKRGGKIIHERDIPKGILVNADQPKPENSNVGLLRNPSKVILLRNMVGPGEVDEDLEPETAEECSKYGKVIRCIIFEIPTSPEEEAVRIFIEFERQEAAIKAIVDLNGRFFGGRTVKATFYNLDRFRRLDLGGPVD